ncbi:hypothetical protein ABI125_15835 [Tamlana crocina]
MKRLALTIIILTISCKKNIEIDEKGIFIKGGIRSEIVISKIKDNTFNNTNNQFPHLYSVKEKARLKIKGKNITSFYENGEEKHLLNGQHFDYKNQLNFHSINKYYYWILEKPNDSNLQHHFPFEFERNYWYSIRDIRFQGWDCYLNFYINNNGEFEYDDLKHINVSPI